MNGKFKCIVVDPPWDQGKTGKRSTRPNQGTELSYSTMTYEQISKIPIDKWATKDAFLWLWATNSKSRSSGKPILVQAFDLMKHWGFEYYTMITWVKSTGPCPFGPYQIVTEYCLFGYRGKFDFPKESMGKMQNAFSSPVTRHSEKPSLLYQNINTYFDGPKIDVFARRKHPGFKSWGDQVEGET